MLETTTNGGNLKVLLVGLSDPRVHASTRTRVAQYVPYLQELGVECRLIDLLDPRTVGANPVRPGVLRHAPWTATRFAQLAVMAAKCDIVLVHQMLMPRPFQDLLLRLSKSVVFDFVDAPTATDHGGESHDRKAFLRFQKMVRRARATIVENEANAAFASAFSDNVHCILGPIDTRRYQPSARGSDAESVTIGWIGSPSAQRHLGLIRDAVEEVQRRFPSVDVKLIGADPSLRLGSRCRSVSWHIDTELRALRDVDIGLMPLVDSAWTRRKGGYKLLQYMSIGIPAVCSPVGVNTDLIRHGENGFNASSSQEWVDALSQLVQDRSLRRQMGERGRARAELEYSHRVAAPRLRQILQTAAGMR